jgi:hypothetical protein
MDTLNRELHEMRTAAGDLLEACQRAGSVWSAPRAPGKWSPAQVVEHVARALDESSNTLDGLPTKFPTFPTVVRTIARTVFFNRVLKNSRFPNARTTKPMNPAFGPADVAAGRARLDAAVDRFDAACRRRLATDPMMSSTLFGRVPVADYARFQMLHIRHHQRQIPD